MLTISSIGKAGARTRFYVIVCYCESIYIIITPRDSIRYDSGHCGAISFIISNLTVSPFSQLLNILHHNIITPVTIKTIRATKMASHDIRVFRIFSLNIKYPPGIFLARNIWIVFLCIYCALVMEQLFNRQF